MIENVADQVTTLTEEQRERIRNAWALYRDQAHDVAAEIRNIESTLAFAIARGRDRDAAGKSYVKEYLKHLSHGDNASAIFYDVLKEIGAPARPIYFSATWVGFVVVDEVLIDFEILEAMGIKPTADAIAFDQEKGDANDFKW